MSRLIGRWGIPEAEAPIFWPPGMKSPLIGKDPDAGKDGRKKGVAEDEMVEWHHQLNGHEFEQTAGDSEGQGSLACCSPWGHKELDMTVTKQQQQHQQPIQKCCILFFRFHISLFQLQESCARDPSTLSCCPHSYLHT